MTRACQKKWRELVARVSTQPRNIFSTPQLTSTSVPLGPGRGSTSRCRRGSLPRRARSSSSWLCVAAAARVGGMDGARGSEASRQTSSAKRVFFFGLFLRMEIFSVWTKNYPFPAKKQQGRTRALSRAAGGGSAVLPTLPRLLYIRSGEQRPRRGWAEGAASVGKNSSCLCARID